MDQLLSKALAGAALTAVLALGLATVSVAGIHPPVRSGNTFSIAACDENIGQLTARCHARIVTDQMGNIYSRNASPNFTPSGFGAGQLQSAYSIPAVVINPGTGPTVAIVDAFGYIGAEADLGVYRSQFSLGACTTGNGCFKKVNQSGFQGAYPRENGGWAQETALDLDMVSAMCPNCKILLVEATTNSFADLATAVNTAAALGAHVISNSYGGGEGGSTPYESAYNHPGVAVTVSSGDSGFGVQFPASSPHVIAVGGTHLVLPHTETVWSGAGSGCSAIYAKPAWQHDPLCTNRMEADVSAVADPNTGVAVYAPASSRRGTLFPGWLVFGGTSVAAPLIGGVYGANGGAVNYGQNPYAAGPGLLRDVPSGSNGSCGGTYLCTGVVGYDGPTGLGTPIGLGAF